MQFTNRIPITHYCRFISNFILFSYVLSFSSFLYIYICVCVCDVCVHPSIPLLISSLSLKLPRLSFSLSLRIISYIILHNHIIIVLPLGLTRFPIQWTIPYQDRIIVKISYTYSLPPTMFNLHLGS